MRQSGVEQKGLEAWATPDPWSSCGTTDSCAVANPLRVEHLIQMILGDRLPGAVHDR